MILTEPIGEVLQRNTPYKKEPILELLGFLKSSQFTQLIISFYLYYFIISTEKKFVYEDTERFMCLLEKVQDWRCGADVVLNLLFF